MATFAGLHLSLALGHETGRVTHVAGACVSTGAALDCNRRGGMHQFLCCAGFGCAFVCLNSQDMWPSGGAGPQQELCQQSSLGFRVYNSNPVPECELQCHELFRAA